MSNSPIKLRLNAEDTMWNGRVYTQETDGRFVHSDGGFLLAQRGSTGWEFTHPRSIPSLSWTLTELVDAQAFKADDGKPNWYLLMSAKGCAKALAGIVRVLSFAVAPKERGGKGYTEHSWREVPDAKARYESALYRHLSAINRGETHDAESKESHWYHVATNAVFLAELHNAEEKQ